MDFELGTIVKVPRGTVGLTPLLLEMEEIFSAEKRVPDLATVNKGTATELMKTFIEGYQNVNKYLTQVSFEYNQALTNADKRKAVVILDEVPRILQEKGLATSKSPTGSEDLRKAVLLQDNEYTCLLEVINALEAVREWLKGKLKSFEMSYRSAKSVFYTDEPYDFTNAHNLRNGNDLVGNIGNPRY